MSKSQPTHLLKLVLNLSWLLSASCSVTCMLLLIKQTPIAPLTDQLPDVGAPIGLIGSVALFWFATSIIGHMFCHSLGAFVLGTVSFVVWFYVTVTTAYALDEPLGFIGTVLGILAWVLFSMAATYSPPVFEDSQPDKVPRVHVENTSEVGPPPSAT